MTIKEYLLSQKEKRSARLAEIEKEFGSLEERNKSADKTEELEAISEKIESLKAERKAVEADIAELDVQIADAEKKEEEEKRSANERRNNFLVFDTPEERKEKDTMTKEEMEARAKAFAEKNQKTLSVAEMRATLVSSGDIATPTAVRGIQPNFQRVSSIIDLIRVEDNEGLGSVKYAYEDNNPEARDQTEGEAVTIDDTTYKYVEMTPTSIEALRQISKQVRKQSPLNYEAKVTESAEKALRLKCAKFVTQKIVASTLISKPTDLKISAIDEKTLRKIALSYGGADGVEGSAWLFLNKKDLIKFGDVRSDTTLQAVYEITPDTNNPNTGVIKDGGLAVRYCLDSNLPALEDADADAVSFFYGQPECAVLGLFSAYEVAVSEDFAFTKNMLTIRGDAEIGCVVDHKDGFVAVTKAGE